MLNRKPNLGERDIAELHKKAIEALELLKELLPERHKSNQSEARDVAGGESTAWNFWKAHSMLHAAAERLRYGWAENTSAQGAECAHKVSMFFFTYFHNEIHTFS